MTDKTNAPENEISAINTSIKTTREVRDEFKKGLGFDPEDINQLSEQMDHFDADISSTHLVENLLQMQKDMGEMLIGRFANNMAAFKKYIPSVYEQFKNYRPKETLEFICTSNGIPNLYFTERNEFLYKVYNPVELCNKQVDLILKNCPFKQLVYHIDLESLGQIHHRYLNDIVRYQNRHIVDTGDKKVPESCPIAIMVGCGLGYHIGYLYEQVAIGNLIVIEPNLDLFFASLHAFDWANLLEYINSESRGIYFMVGQKKDDVFKDLYSFYERHGNMLAGFMWSMVHYRSEEINEIADELIKEYERTFSTLGFFDDHLFGISHAMYQCTHHCRFVRSDLPLPLEFRSRPLCVVANGPSLSHDLPFLRKIQDKVIIMACGTAIETLYNAGIKPTLYAATERLRVVSEHLSLIPDKDFLKDVILVTSDVAHPETVKMFRHMAIFGKADETFFMLAANYMYPKVRHLNGICMMNPLVGNLGAASAAQFEFKNVYFFGLDNGTKRADLMTHPEENLFYRKQEEKSRGNVDKTALYVGADINEQDEKDAESARNNRAAFSNLIYEGEGNFGGKVATSYIYRLSAKYIGVLIRASHDRDTKFFNCSDGLAIEGATPVHSEDLLKDWEKLDDFDRDAFIEFMDKRKTFDIDLTEEEAEKMCQKETFDYVVNTLQHYMMKTKRPTTRLGYVLLLQSVCEIFTTLNGTRDSFISDLLDGSINNFFIMIIRALYLTDDEQEAIGHAEKLLSLVNDFLEDCKKLYKFLPYYYAEDHHKFLNGKVGFDHEDSKAPPVTPREPHVTQEDRDSYPMRKFVKRYE